ncbi:IPT/TIG domain-containing protein [Haliangium sp.]|uniref:IPT/TIG domain-containing protein n=1 Tax=Haliangium sp. TaxID=2663208 RepID=UPI003D12B65D
MPAPTITSIQPDRGLASGQTLVTLIGAGLRLPPPCPSISVYFGELPATDVQVRAQAESTIATCLTPPGQPGPVDVVIENLDDNGAPIAGETVHVPGAYTYERPELGAEPDLVRLVRALIRALKAQALPNVSLMVHTDFVDVGDEDASLAFASTAELPALILVGPELRENRFYALNQRPEDPLGDGRFALRRAPYTVDLGFTLIGVTDHTAELLALMTSCTLFLHKNKHLHLLRDPAEPALGHVAYELDLAPGGAFQVRSRPNDANVRHCSGELVIRGFDIDQPGGIVVREGRAVDVVQIAAPALIQE